MARNKVVAVFINLSPGLSLTDIVMTLSENTESSVRTEAATYETFSLRSLAIHLVDTDSITPLSMCSKIVPNKWNLYVILEIYLFTILIFRREILSHGSINE